jgi:hypothetical protein
MRAIPPFMGTRRSQRIADVLGVYHFRTATGTSTPMPRVGRPAGIAPRDRGGSLTTQKRGRLLS